MTVFASAPAGAESATAARDSRAPVRRMLRAFMSGLQDELAGGGLLDALGLGAGGDLEPVGSGPREGAPGGLRELHRDRLGLADGDAVARDADAAHVLAELRPER